MTNDLIICVSDDLRYVMTEEHYSYLTIVDCWFLRFKDARVDKGDEKVFICKLHSSESSSLKSMCMLLEEVSAAKFLTSYNFIRIFCY